MRKERQPKTVSRRDFLKLGGLSVGAIILGCTPEIKAKEEIPELENHLGNDLNEYSFFEFEDEEIYAVNLEEEDKVFWDEQGVLGYTEHNNKLPHGDMAGEGKVKELIGIRNYSEKEGKWEKKIWARVECEGDCSEEAAWHLVETLRVKDGNDWPKVEIRKVD